MVATSSNRGMQVPTVGGDAGVWGNELNTTITDLDTMLGGSITFNASAAATVTLTTSQAQFGRIVFSGTPSSSMVLNFNSTIAGPYGNFDVWNATSTSANSGAGFNILCQVTSTSTGATASIPVSNMRLVNVDGQNVQFADQVIIPTTTLPPVLNGYLGGLGTSNDGTSPNTFMFFAAGIAADSSAVLYMQSAATFRKTASAAWAQGSANGGMGQGLTFTAGTWYHSFIISNGTSSNIDFYFDTSPSGANKPANTNAFRRIASMKTTSSAAAWQRFTQYGDQFWWNNQITDTVTIPNASSSPSVVTLSVPTGVQVEAFMVTYFQDPGGGANVQMAYFPTTVSDPFAASSGADPGSDYFARSIPGVGLTEIGCGPIRCFTNLSAQINVGYSFPAGAPALFQIDTRGWIDTRGRNYIP